MPCCDDLPNDMQCWDGLVTSTTIYSNNPNYVPKGENLNLLLRFLKGIIY